MENEIAGTAAEAEAIEDEEPTDPSDPDGPLVLGPMLRYVDATSATIWVETDRPGTVEVLGASSHTFTVAGHHYALVVVDGLEPASMIEYDVRLDGEVVWPDPDSELPPSVIRTFDPDRDVSILFGSCRAAAPHEPPYTLELANDDDGRGIDTLWAHARRMLGEAPEDWPTLLLLIGDQIYADDSSPSTQERIKASRPDDSDLPPSIVGTFEEYCWLYAEAWSKRLERWLLSVVPSVMIFDDHDMIDSWNISQSWRDDHRQLDWWSEHAIGGYMSYWIYQHLGNLSPSALREETLLTRVAESDDGTEVLRSWAAATDSVQPGEATYRFSFARAVGDVKVVVIDSRNNRVFDGERRIVGADEWGWVREQALDHPGHVLLGTTLPVFLPDGLHDLHTWNVGVCEGKWGKRFAKLGEKIRREIDLDDWPAFAASYADMIALIEDLDALADPPGTVVIVAGDIHFSFSARLPYGTGRTRAHQVVSSPIRNALIPYERGAMRFTLTRTGAVIGSVLRRLVRGPRTAPHFELTSGPYFANNMCELRYAGDDVELVVEHATPDDDGKPQLAVVADLSL